MELSIGAQSIITFVMLTTRIVTVMVVAPPFSGGTVPGRIRIAIAVALSIAVTPAIDHGDVAGPSDAMGVFELMSGIAFQIVAGATLGLAISLLFAAVSSAGAIIDMMSGLSSGSLYDPSLGTAVTPVGRMYQTIALTTLFITNGHLLLMRGVIRSYEAAPLAGLRIDLFGEFSLHAVRQFFLAAIEIALPVMITMAVTEVVLGIATRAAPKLNVLVIGFATKSLLLLMVLTVTLPLLLNGSEALFLSGIRHGARLIGG